MAFRSSTLPDWSLSERDGYYSNRSPRSSETSSPSPPQNLRGGCVSATQQKYTCVSKDLKREEIKIKVTRLVQPMGIAFSVQLFFIVMFSFVFPREYWSKKDAGLYYYLGLNYIYNVGFTLLYTLLSTSSVILGVLVYLIMFMITTCLHGVQKYPETMLEQLCRYATLRFLMKPVAFGVISWMYCSLFISVFDSTYSAVLVQLPKSPDETEIQKATFFVENSVVVRLTAFLTGVTFFLHNFLTDGFFLRFPTTRAKSSLSSFIEYTKIPRVIQDCFMMAVFVWLTCLMFGPLLYSPIFSFLDIGMQEPNFVNRLLLFIEVGFLFRICLWACLPRLSLHVYFSLVNDCLTEIIDLPIETPSSNSRCLLLSDAMMCSNAYLKYLSFYEFNLKASQSHPDVLVFFNITHPGNHPLNWKGVFTAACTMFTNMNNDIIKFLKSVSLPASTSQIGLQPFVLNQLRKEKEGLSENTFNEKQDFISDSKRPLVMRDLTATMQPDLPQIPPTLYDLVSQIPSALLSDLKDAGRGLFSMQNLNNLIFLGKLEQKMPEKQVFNLLMDRMLIIWGMVGCLKLITIGLDADNKGIVHQDIKDFLKKVLETHDTLQALEFYVCSCLDKEDTLDRNAFNAYKTILAKMVNTTTFVLTKLHTKLSNCYSILNISEDCLSRIAEMSASH